MKVYRVVNTSTYSKRLILGSRTEQVKAKDSIEVALSPAELDLAKHSPDILVSEVDATPQQIRLKSRGLNLPEHFHGASGTVAPKGQEKQRPLYEHFMVELFGLKSRIASLEAKNAALEAIVSHETGDLAENIMVLIKRVSELENRPLQIVQSSSANVAPSELLNVEANPQEANREIFKKLVDQNKELRSK